MDEWVWTVLGVGARRVFGGRGCVVCHGRVFYGLPQCFIVKDCMKAYVSQFHIYGHCLDVVGVLA